ncbi:MAG TPA: acyl-CoA dehydrogenase [Deltaproteobacteria bacterium]|nr:acyl-CoA dehydrogenase [Deltaproteobacteria bacterium]
MDFDLSNEQEILQETVDKFIGNVCPITRVRELSERDDPYDEELWDRCVDLGLGGLLVPEEYGGAGLGLLDAALVVESLGRGAVPSPFIEHTVAVLALRLGGSREQKRKWLPGMAQGDVRGCVALGEQENAWFGDRWTTRFDSGAGGREGVRGTKAPVSFGAGSDLVVVGTAGGGLVLVEGADPGLRFERIDGIDRTRRLDRLEIEGASGSVLSARDGIASRVVDAWLVLLAADAFGGAVACLARSVAYAKEREQFGVKIGSFQALKHQLANMALEVEPARTLYWYAAHAFDRELADASCAAAAAKSAICDRYLRIARSAVEVHGGIGYTWECDIQLFLKRALFDGLYLGDSRVHYRRIAESSGW